MTVTGWIAGFASLPDPPPPIPEPSTAVLLARGLPRWRPSDGGAGGARGPGDAGSRRRGVAAPAQDSSGV